MSKRPQQTAHVTLSAFSKKGNGVGFTDDALKRRVEVPFTIPGDCAKVILQSKKGGIFASSLEEIEVPSPNRIAPRCIHFGSCGGCRWQQMKIENQLALKQSSIEMLFRPLMLSDQSIRKIIACHDPWAYRNKMEFTFSSDAAGQKYLGLIMNASRGKVLNLTECHLVRPWFAHTLKAVRSWWIESSLTAFHPHRNAGSLRTLILREGITSGDRLVMLTVSGDPEYALSRQQMDSFIAFVQDAAEPLTHGTLSIFLRIQHALKGQETNFFEMLLHGPDQIRETLNIQIGENQSSRALSFSISPSAFFQPNTKQAETLYSTALQLLHIDQEAVVYDLYCGTGTLGICAAMLAKQVFGIEISPEASLDARSNIQRNHLSNIRIITGAVREVMRSIQKGGELPLPDIIMLDPPRSGLDPETLQHLVELRPKKILYISCNPATQAENVKVLLQAGYQIMAIQPVDQFPHTVHIENIVVLEAISTA